MEEKVNVPNAAEGSPIEAATNEAQAMENATQTPETTNSKKGGFSKFLKSWFSKKNIVKSVAVLVAVAILIGGGLFYLLFFSASPASVAERYVIANYEFDNSTICRVCAFDFKSLYMTDYYDCADEEEFCKKVNREYKEDNITSWNKFCKACYNSHKQRGVIVSAETTKEADLSNEELNKLKEVLSSLYAKDPDRSERYGLSPDDISVGKLCTVKVQISDQQETFETTEGVHLVKLKGSWKVFALGYLLTLRDE